VSGPQSEVCVASIEGSTPHTDGDRTCPRRRPTKKANRKTNPQPEPIIEAPAPKLSALDAAARVLAEAGTFLTPKQMIGIMAVKGYWSSPGGKTPHATLYAAIAREIATKGPASRFHKAAPGRFAAAESTPSSDKPAKGKQRAAE